MLPGWFPSEGPAPILCDEDDDEDKEEKEGCLCTDKNIAHFCVYRLMYVEHCARVMQLKRAQIRIIIRMGRALQYLLGHKFHLGS